MYRNGNFGFVETFIYRDWFNGQPSMIESMQSTDVGIKLPVGYIRDKAFVGTFPCAVSNIDL
jgi:hypothetical protein